MKKLAVLFGGIGYHCDKPLLYYAREAAYDKGYTEYINIDYKISAHKDKNLKQIFDEIFVQAEEKLAEIDWESYDEVLLISKSIGTVAAAAYAEKYANIFKEKDIRNVYLTPLEMTFEHQPCGGIAFVGTSDPCAEIASMTEMCKAHGIELHIIPGTNHSLESDDIWRNMDILKDVIREINDYI